MIAVKHGGCGVIKGLNSCWTEDVWQSIENCQPCALQQVFYVPNHVNNCDPRCENQPLSVNIELALREFELQSTVHASNTPQCS